MNKLTVNKKNDYLIEKYKVICIGCGKTRFEKKAKFAPLPNPSYTDDKRPGTISCLLGNHKFYPVRSIAFSDADDIVKELLK